MIKKFRIKIFFFLCAVIFIHCTPTIKQFYPDNYFQQDQIYENKSLRFLLTFKGNWNIVTDPNMMDKESQKYARFLNKSGVELLFIGNTFEGLHGTKGIAINLNEPAQEYAEYIRHLNKDQIDNDFGLVEFQTEQNKMIKWIYEKHGFKFAEFFFNINTYDIRISFWSSPEYFKNFLSVYEEIISTMIITSGF